MIKMHLKSQYVRDDDFFWLPATAENITITPQDDECPKHFLISYIVRVVE